MTHDTAGSLALDAYRQVFLSSPDYISISRLSDGRYIDVNPGYEHFTGYTRSEVIGQTSSTLNIWFDAQARTDFVEALQKTGVLQGFATRLRTKSGALRHVEASATITVIDGEPALVAIVRDVTERKRLDDELAEYRVHLEAMVEKRTTELKHMAQHDVLTGLPNRALLVDRIAQAIHHAHRYRGGMAVVAVDLDRFKQVNDTLGHGVGDVLLKQVAQRLQALVRKSDTVARMGGDEFVLILKDVCSQEVVSAVATKIRDAMALAFDIEGHAVQVGGSIGVAMYPGDGADGPTLLKCADVAMYDAKQAGRGQFRFFQGA